MRKSLARLEKVFAPAGRAAGLAGFACAALAAYSAAFPPSSALLAMFAHFAQQGAAAAALACAAWALWAKRPAWAWLAAGVALADRTVTGIAYPWAFPFPGFLGVAAMAACTFAVVRRAGTAGGAFRIAACVLAATAALPFPFPPSAPAGAPTVVFQNMLYWNEAPTAAADALASYGAKAVAVAELAPDAAVRLDAKFPADGAVAEKESGASSVGAWAKQGFLDKQIFPCGGWPSVRATLKNGLALYVMHPLPPFDADYRARQEACLSDLAGRLAADDVAGRRYLAVGDFNAAPWSPSFRDNLGARDLAVGASWSGELPLAMPLDHAITNVPGARAAVLPDARGSDHRPVGVWLPEPLARN